MIRKLLIANRGEIAVRIMRTAHRMGISTVAIYSDADAGAYHVELADEAVRIGPAPVAESYLKADTILKAALDTGADAIHPGYGFLSENPEFAEAVSNSGLIFVGPPASAIRAMGLKDAAKALMEKANVPVVPGYHGSNQDENNLAEQAEAIGYPVLIKAVAGGGGKGMRRVDAPGDFGAALKSARSEAATAFGNDAVLIEKYVAAPRHIEIQVFGDSHGNAVHLFERDCSLQRRHQKVIEEAPAPGMTERMRAAMGRAATDAAKAIGYSGAGTIEFIVDGSDGLRPDRFWFMEMNTRLQVEHPVTEAITGEDLVEWQLRVAAGEPLPKSQDQITLNGHAVEARLYAEDPAKGFLPATGRLSHLAFPGTIRVDSGIRAGDEISPFYDPMIAKLVAHGPTRDAAIAQLHRALIETEIAGSTTNLPFLARLIAQPDFAAARLDTGLIERHLDALTPDPAPSPAITAIAAVAALGLHGVDAPHTGFHLWTPLAQPITLIRAGIEATHMVETLGPGLHRVGELTLERNSAKGNRFTYRVEGENIAVSLLAVPFHVTLLTGGDIYPFEIKDLSLHETASSNANSITAPMPGLVKELLAKPGQSVEKGDPLLILEAMKMEHSLTAPRDGTIAEVMTTQGAQVEGDAVLIRLNDPDA